MKKMIAYQTVDIEGDIWCNKALLFSSDEKAVKFFSNPSNVFKALEYELGEDEEWEDVVASYEILQGVSGLVYGVTFTCEFAGETKIREMSRGILVA